jgi:hypothetical protein
MTASGSRGATRCAMDRPRRRNRRLMRRREGFVGVPQVEGYGRYRLLAGRYAQGPTSDRRRSAVKARGRMRRSQKYATRERSAKYRLTKIAMIDPPNALALYRPFSSTGMSPISIGVQLRLRRPYLRNHFKIRFELPQSSRITLRNCIANPFASVLEPPSRY